MPAALSPRLLSTPLPAFCAPLNPFDLKTETAASASPPLAVSTRMTFTSVLAILGKRSAILAMLRRKAKLEADQGVWRKALTLAGIKKVASKMTLANAKHVMSLDRFACKQEGVRLECMCLVRAFSQILKFSSLFTQI